MPLFYIKTRQSMILMKGGLAGPQYLKQYHIQSLERDYNHYYFYRERGIFYEQ